jgi:2-polyprenyl-3-methyl-5-hydroxy-6-metoxy-1,4-benzoquinol methylase
MAPRNSPDFNRYAGRTAAVWDALADWWDDAIGAGNPTQDLLVEPVQARLLGEVAGREVLDVACGAGRFTRRLASDGAEVVAFDQSPRFIARARQATPPELAGRINYLVADAGDVRALKRLGKRRFSAAVCTMALMDIAVITPLLRALTELLVTEGIFVFSVTHPAFNSGDARIIGEQVVRQRTIDVDLAVRIRDYLTARAYPDVGIAGQPLQQTSFHRPVSALLNACFDAGFVLDRLEEPAFPPASQTAAPQSLSWANITTLPQVLVARLRLPA